MIALMFPVTLDRRHVKAKYNLEERLNPSRITMALRNKKKPGRESALGLNHVILELIIPKQIQASGPRWRRSRPLEPQVQRMTTTKMMLRFQQRKRSR